MAAIRQALRWRIILQWKTSRTRNIQCSKVSSATFLLPIAHDTTGKTYLDHGGTTIYAKSLIESFAADMISNLYGNPHSASAPSKSSGKVVDDTRERALRFFGADPEHFDLVFVANTTAAIKLVMTSFEDLGNAGRTVDGGEGGFWYGYHIDSHNSIIGVREVSDGNHRCFGSDAEVEQWLSASSMENQPRKLGLFAYPGQSNMTGRRLPLTWPGTLRKSIHTCHQDIYTLLDVAALATTSPLNGVFSDPDLAPDFAALSFYKIFGFPDLGGLIIRKASGKVLQRRKYFGGGSVSLVTVLGNKPWFAFKEVLHESLEDGTLPFHSIIALKAAINTHERLYGPNPMKTISQHTCFLIKRLYDAMSSLRHSNGLPVCQIYKGSSSAYGDSKTQGATISFNIIRADGTYVPYKSVVETLADSKNVYVRSGHLCNPGGIVMHLGIDTWQFEQLQSCGHQCGSADDTGTEIINGKPTGVVRVSLGAMTTIANVDALILFLQKTFLGSAKPETTSFQAQRQSLVVRSNGDRPGLESVEKQLIYEVHSQEPLVPLPIHDLSILEKTETDSHSPPNNSSLNCIDSSWTGAVGMDQANLRKAPMCRQPVPLSSPVQSDFRITSEHQGEELQISGVVWKILGLFWRRTSRGG
jgi:molybdenum cofactor sulfurtransferase